MNPLSESPQEMSALEKRYNDLRDKKIAAETNLKTSKDQLDSLKSEAQEKYGSDDIDTLRAKLEEMKQENERSRAQYQLHLASIEQELAQVEAEHAKAAKQGTER